ncbi:MAG: cytochrome C, partial [Nitrosomonas sp.]|nr:cytochrome C [Nitrosomonas sp.]
TEGATCIDCHQNLVHEEAPMTDLNASLATGKMVLKPEDEEDDDDEDEDEDEEDENAEESDTAAESSDEDGSEDDDE